MYIASGTRNLGKMKVLFAVTLLLALAAAAQGMPGQDAVRFGHTHLSSSSACMLLDEVQACSRALLGPCMVVSLSTTETSLAYGSLGMMPVYPHGIHSITHFIQHWANCIAMTSGCSDAVC